MIFQKMQEQKCRRVTDKVFAAIRYQWQQEGAHRADMGIECDPTVLAGEMLLPRLSAQQMIDMHQAVKQRLATEGIPLVVTIELDSTVIAWRYVAVGV